MDWSPYIFQGDKEKSIPWLRDKIDKIGLYEVE